VADHTDPEYVSEKFLENLTGISVKTWQWLRHTGTGPTYHKIGRRCQYHLPTVKRWIASRERLSTSAAHPANSTLS
jgi:hypothetical protein